MTLDVGSLPQFRFHQGTGPTVSHPGTTVYSAVNADGTFDFPTARRVLVGVAQLQVMSQYT